MCPGEICYTTFEFADHFVIAPAIKFSSRSNDFTVNALNEKGKLVPEGYEYDSLSNGDFLSVEQIQALNIHARL
jgi:UDP-N-acetylglucosamine 4,6-dehydratase